MLAIVMITLASPAMGHAPGQNPWDLQNEVTTSCTWSPITLRPWASVQDAPNAKGADFESKSRHFKVEAVAVARAGIVDVGEYATLQSNLRQGDAITLAMAKSGLLGARLPKGSTIKHLYAYPLVDAGTYYVVRTYADARIFECSKHRW